MVHTQSYASLHFTFDITCFLAYTFLVFAISKLFTSQNALRMSILCIYVPISYSIVDTHHVSFIFPCHSA